MTYNFFNPTRVLFGAGQLENLHTQEMPGRKAMVVISNGKSTRESGALDRVMEQMNKAGVETVLFDKVGANPLKAIVEEGRRFAKKKWLRFCCGFGRWICNGCRQDNGHVCVAAWRSLGLCSRCYW